MIAREWKCLCPRLQRDGFLVHLERTGVREAKTTPGYRGHMVLERMGEMCSNARSATVEIGLVTFWESWDAVHRFAGDNPERALLFPGDDRFDIVPDKHVRHYEVLETSMK